MLQNDSKSVTTDVRVYTRQVFVHQVVMAAVATIVAGAIVKSMPWSFLWGALASLGDNIIFLRGINKGMSREPIPSAFHMRSRIFLRLGLLLVTMALGIYLGLHIFSIFGGYILLHITLLINMIWLTKKQKK